MQLPSWLRWQAPRFSAWLIGYLAVWALIAFVAPALIDWTQSGGSFGKAYWGYVERVSRSRTGPTTYMYAHSLIGTTLLVWFTYFSGNPRVKDHDRFSVLLMLCGSVMGWTQMILHLFDPK